jgi:hypothetical protein
MKWHSGVGSNGEWPKRDFDTDWRRNCLRNS